MFNELPSPIIICHRGAKSYAPENTLAAFKAALELGADGFELDTQLTSDGHVVVFHDPTVDHVAHREFGDLAALQMGMANSQNFHWLNCVNWTRVVPFQMNFAARRSPPWMKCSKLLANVPLSMWS